MDLGRVLTPSHCWALFIPRAPFASSKTTRHIQPPAPGTQQQGHKADSAAVLPHHVDTCFILSAFVWARLIHFGNGLT